MNPGPDTGPLTRLLDRGEESSPAFVVPEDGGGVPERQVLTYGQVAARVETLAQRLAGAGVRRGDRVALALPNGPDFVLLLLAVTALGAAAAPLNPAYTQAEFGFFLTDIAPRLLLIPASRRGRPATAAASTATDGAGRRGYRRRPAGVARRLPAAAPAQRSFEPGGPEDVALVLHTSGTTSRPKQVPLRQRNLMASVGLDRRALPARPGRRLVLRDAAVPHPRPGRLHVRRARRGRHGRRAAPVHAAAGSGPRRASTGPPGCRPARRCTR